MDSGKRGSASKIKIKERSVDANAGVDFAVLAPTLLWRFVDVQGPDYAAMV